MKTNEPIALAGPVLLDSRNRIGLLHRNTPELEQWELPGGRVEDGELPNETAMREALEELGVRITIVRKLGHAAFLEKDQEFHYTWFLADITRGRPEPREAKFDKFDYFRVRELAKLSLSPNVQNLCAARASGDISLNIAR